MSTRCASYRGILPVSEDAARVDGELLKVTRTYCPTCMQELDGRVYEVHGLVWMYKHCPEHGPSQGLVERDAAFYRKLMNPGRAPENPAWALVIPVTHRCNLRCSICFVPSRSRADLTAEQIRSVVEAVEMPWIAMSGGEPTMRRDLAQLIEHVAAIGKHAIMNTNGIRLADRAYARRLAEAGLEWVVLAFNGLDDSVHQRINGRPLLDLKLQALENLVENHVSVVISPTLVRGVNEGLGPLVELCRQRWPAVRQLRVRAAARVGAHSDLDPLVLSELVALLAGTIGRTSAELCDEFDTETAFHSANQWIMEACLYRDGPRRGELLAWHPGDYSRAWSPLERFEREVAAQTGGDMSESLLASRFTFPGFHLWAWPDRHTIDLEEIKATGIAHLHGERRVMNFFDAVVRGHDL